MTSWHWLSCTPWIVRTTTLWRNITDSSVSEVGCVSCKAITTTSSWQWLVLNVVWWSWMHRTLHPWPSTPLWRGDKHIIAFAYTDTEEPKQRRKISKKGRKRIRGRGRGRIEVHQIFWIYYTIPVQNINARKTSGSMPLSFVAIVQSIGG